MSEGFICRNSGDGYATINFDNVKVANIGYTSLTNRKMNLSATTVGSYALFAGGYSIGGTYYSDVDAYSTNLSHTTPTSLNETRGYYKREIL